jgi:hypothetical protein
MQDKHNQFILNKINRDLQKQNAWRTTEYWNGVVAIAAVIGAVWVLFTFFF